MGLARRREWLDDGEERSRKPSMNENLESIVELQSTINRLNEAEQRLHGIPDWMRELHEEHAARKDEISALEGALAAAAHDRRTAEAAIADSQEKLKKFQQQISRVTNQREYGAVLQEIDTVKAQIAGSEEAALASIERHDTAQKELAAVQVGFRSVEERYSAELARWEREKPAVARQVADLKTRIEELRQRLPKGLLTMFERVLVRYPSGALAPVRPIERPARGQREWHCTACNYRVRPQVVVEIRNTANLVQCDACKRILYLEPEAEG
jgi:predicted  nucleic acid-binding Zn-ribbon protein